MTVEGKKFKLRKVTLICHIVEVSIFAAGIMLIFFGALMIFLAPHLINITIRQQKNIARDSELYHLWENPDYKFSSEIFVYSVKNPHQILDGNRPEMVQVGPYVYKVHIEKNILGFGNDSVKYQNVQSFIFDKNASCAECSLLRKIWIPNIVFQKFVEMASNPLTSIAKVSLISQQPFLKISVNDTLFNGYEDPYLANICAIPLADIICKSLKVPDKIGYLMHKNGTQKIVEVTTGNNDGSVTAGEILNWDGLNLLPDNWWNSRQAREINGTIGELYKPFIKKTDKIYVFAPDLCRSIHLTFAEEFDYKNIPAYRFTVKEDLLDPAVPGNEGFCHNDGKMFFSDDEKCLPKGLLDLSHCYNGTPPILFSFPNFLYADKRIKESVIGLNESSVEHDSIIIDIEPQTGTLLRIYIRSQINIAVWKGQGIITHDLTATDLSRMRSTIVPLFAEYQLVEIGNGSLEFLRKKLLFIKKSFAFLCIIPICAGILLIVIAIFIEFSIKTRLMNKIMRQNSNKVTVQVLQSLPDNQKDASYKPDNSSA